MRNLRWLTLGLLVAALVTLSAATGTEAAPLSDISITKGVTPASPNMYHPGDTVHYVMTVRNASATESMQIDVVEDKLPDNTTVSLNTPPLPYTLGPGAVQNYTYDWQIPANACTAFPTGMVVNHLHVVGVQFSTVNDPFDADVQKTSLVLCPCLSVTKTADPTTSKAGDVVTYTITVHNCGNCALTLTNITDSLLGDISASFATTLAIGATETHQFTRTVLVGDPDPLVNTVTANYHDPLALAVSQSASATVDLVHPNYTVTKTCLTNPVPPGAPAQFQITITNTGDVDLIFTTDDAAIPGPFTVATGGAPFVQAVSHPVPPGAQEVCNTITVTATLPPALGLPNVIIKTASACCPVSVPCVSVTKTADPTTSKAGDVVTYTIAVHNCGNGALTLTNVLDSLLGDISASFATTLAIGATETHQFTRTVLVGDPDPLVNTVTVNYHDVTGFAVTATASATVDLVHPNYTVTKTCLTNPVPPGAPAQFQITITNTGDVDLIFTTDDAAIPGPFTVATGGAPFVQTVSHAVPPGAQEVCNTITVTATLPPALGLPNVIIKTASACCPVSVPCVSVTKTADPTTSKAGDVVTYTIAVHNCGNGVLTLTNVLDSLLGDISASFATTLAVGATETHQFTRTVLVGDPDPLVNTVTVNYHDVTGFAVTATASATVDLVHPNYTVTKTCLTNPVPPGAPAQFQITITNTGDVDLIFTTDDAAIPGPFTVATGGAPFVQAVSHAVPPGAQEVCNTITVTATLPPALGLPNVIIKTANACCPVSVPCVSVTKTADPTTSKAGDVVTYTIAVHNCGNGVLTLTNVLDSLLGDISASFATTLAVGATETHQFTRTVLVGDPDPLVNTVTVNYHDVTGFAVTATASATVDLVHPNYTVTKTCLTNPVPPGAPAQFQITITNTGDVDLIFTTDDAAIPGPFTVATGGAPFVQAVSHAVPPGAQEVCNTITVTATLPPALGLPNVIIKTANACCPVSVPCVSVTKTADPTTSKAGDVVTYTIAVHNCGNGVLTLTNITDSLLGNISASFATTLAVGATETHQFTRTVLVGDPDPLVNTVTVNYHDVTGFAVTATASATVDLVHPNYTVTKTCLTDPVPAGGTAQFRITITNTGDVDLIFTTDDAAIPGPFTVATGGAPFVQDVSRPVPAGVSEVCNTINVTATLPPALGLPNVITKAASGCCQVELGNQGCTPGFWKNHPACWCTAYSPTTLVGSVFTVPSQLNELAGNTLMDALRYKGGSGVIGGARNLLRISVSSLLNACNDNVNFPMTVQEVINAVNAALATLDRTPMGTLQTLLDGYNNLGCPVNAHCQPIVPTIGTAVQQAETEVMSVEGALPTAFAVTGVVPNPLAGSTTISFALPNPGKVTVNVYDMLGRRVANLADDDMPAGHYSVVWNGSNIAPGVYFCRVSFGNEQPIMKKLVKLQ